MLLLSILIAIGLIFGRAACVWAVALVDPKVKSGLRMCVICGHQQSFIRQMLAVYPGARCPICGAADRTWPFWSSVAISLVFAGLGWLLVEAGCQTVTEVRPSRDLWQNRLPFQLLFVFLLATATITDFLDYVIPDAVVLPGVLIAVIWSALSGELQIIHVWVNWDDDFVTLYGPYLPEWLKRHQHLHGFVWSTFGLLTGAGLMWVGRAAAHRILGIPAIGFGDVTLMAMIGAFLGWQPTLCVLAIAPLIGVLLGFSGRILTGRSFVAFGPYLCFAAVTVLCSWKILWDSLRLKIIFSHWPTVTGMIFGSFAAFCVLLFGLRVFRTVPTERLR